MHRGSREEAVEQMRAPLSMVDILKLSDEELPLLTDTDDPTEGTRRLAEQQLSHPRATRRLRTGGPWWEEGQDLG